MFKQFRNFFSPETIESKSPSFYETQLDIETIFCVISNPCECGEIVSAWKPVTQDNSDKQQLLQMFV